MTHEKSPAGGATGEALGSSKCLGDTSDYNPFGQEIKDLLRLSRIQQWHGLSGSRATLIAALAFDGGRR